jgi:FdhE protein
MRESWDTLINRAKELASQRKETAELLIFYAELLSAQKEIYEQLRSRADWLPSGDLAEDLSVIRLTLPTLLEVTRRSGPALLAEEAHRLGPASDAEIADMLLQYWKAPTDHHFFAKALLQPYARWLAESRATPIDRALERREDRCPFCAGKPQLALLYAQEPSSEAGTRNLLCSTCFTVWPFKRVLCANCGEERPAKLAYFHTPEYDHARVEACDSCRHYIKAIDLTKFGLAAPLVDEVAAAPLDLWAREKGWKKIELNLLGL